MKPLYRNDWDQRAIHNARGFTASHDHETDERFVSSGRRDARLLLDFAGILPREPTGNALEIGCGIGRLVEAMSDHFDETVGADVSPEMLRRAQERLSRAGKADRARWLLVDGNGTIPTEEKFDFICSYTVFQHIRRAHTVRYIAEVARLLKPAGRAVLHFVEPFGIRRSLQALLHLDPPARDTMRFRYFRAGEVRRICRAAGLQIDAHRKIDFYGLYRLSLTTSPGALGGRPEPGK